MKSHVVLCQRCLADLRINTTIGIRVMTTKITRTCRHCGVNYINVALVENQIYRDAVSNNPFTDTELLDFLQANLDQNKYTGRCIFRRSDTGRGFCFRETSMPGAVPSIRDAIAIAIQTSMAGLDCRDDLNAGTPNGQ